MHMKMTYRDFGHPWSSESGQPEVAVTANPISESDNPGLSSWLRPRSEQDHIIQHAMQLHETEDGCLYIWNVRKRPSDHTELQPRRQPSSETYFLVLAVCRVFFGVGGGEELCQDKAFLSLITRGRHNRTNTESYR